MSASSFRLTCILCLLVSSFSPMSALAFEIPPNDGFITDTVGVLSAEEEKQLEFLITGYQTETTNEIAVVIVESMEGEPLMDAAVDIGRTWGVGTKNNDNGIVILIAYADREMFMATGYGLEGAVPDIVAKGIIDREITPHFRDGKFAEGIEAGILALQKHIGGEYTADRYGNFGTENTPWGIVMFFIFIGVDILFAFLGRTKSWWAGGVFGVIAGLILLLAFGWWLSIPVLAVLGLVLDFFLSRNYKTRRGRSGRRWYGGGGGGRGGGFGGFSGGSFGGGGSRGSW